MAQTLKFCLALISAGLVGCADARLPIDAPNIQSQPPIIYLAANLDEEQRLGWCIDTQGRGFSEALHAHSCKPQSPGDQVIDINFRYDAATRQIQSAAFASKCAELAPNDQTNIGLRDCDSANLGQQFYYNAKTQELQSNLDIRYCLTVSPDINPAGPFQSRALLLEECSSTNAAYKQWIVLE